MKIFGIQIGKQRETPSEERRYTLQEAREILDTDTQLRSDYLRLWESGSHIEAIRKGIQVKTPPRLVNGYWGEIAEKSGDQVLAFECYKLWTAFPCALRVALEIGDREKIAQVYEAGMKSWREDYGKGTLKAVRAAKQLNDSKSLQDILEKDVPRLQEDGLSGVIKSIRVAIEADSQEIESAAYKKLEERANRAVFDYSEKLTKIQILSSKWKDFCGMARKRASPDELEREFKLIEAEERE
jgi:hypothetical protein